MSEEGRGSASLEPPGCSSPSLSLLDGAAMLLLLLAPERLRFGTRRPDERAPPARARFFFSCATSKTVVPSH